ncbi:MAG TPA: HD domain-containing protein [Candidatus Bipolaricaulota bacterium]|nr:HD domain-containing protein [Candidatus Bipolaricaulota bacterium]
MQSKILSEYIERKPEGHEALSAMFEYFQNAAGELSFDDKSQTIELANRLAAGRAGAGFIGAALAHKILKNHPDKEKEIKTLIGEENVKIAMALNLAVALFSEIQKIEYMRHSLNTAEILSRTGMDHLTIITGLLHHVSRLNPESDKIVEEKLGKKLADILQTYKKINHYANKTKSFNSNVREILLVMSQDVRIILVKMASAIDSLINYERIPDEDRYLVAKQAKEILAPIADMLGVWHLRWQLEDYSFRILQPEEYQKIEKRFGEEDRKTRDKYIAKLAKTVRNEAEEKKIKCDVNGRFKHYYSIYRKMKTKQKTFNNIYDVFALRVIVDSVDDCYLMLSLIHGLWPPVPKRIKDYIASPKSNGYQTLHTTIIGPGNQLTEFQIRTKDMHRSAQFGIAAQLFYKNKESEDDWTKKILHTGKSLFHKNVWEDEVSKIFQEKIYVYSPKGDAVSLPKGSTPVDFAYQIHSDLGNYCKFAIINNQPAELNRKLQNEDVIEIIPDINSEGPDLDWLNFVKTPQAEKQIKRYLKLKGLL